MQTQLPFFPSSTRLFNSNCGVFEDEGEVFYLYNGHPIYYHAKSDLVMYRFVVANLVVNNLCTPREISDVFGVSIRNIQLYAKALRDKGSGWFLKREETRGKCYKYTPEVISQAQSLLDRGKSQYQAAKELNVSEGSIRYHLNKGTLKKKPGSKQFNS